MRIVVGIHLQTEPDRVRATLARLHADTGPAFETVLLPDAPDAAMRDYLRTTGLPRCEAVSAGGAASFNRLLQAGGGADVLVFLEAGALTGPGWLQRLLDALDADPCNGLAGPSTNRSWNMQAAFPQAREAELARVAALASSRFGSAWQSTAPLHCLADFCYAVQRRVVDAIGGADERYGTGPCWEMDYSVRASRAGFRAVWAKGAFVHRRPPAAVRQRDEDRAFDASRRLYQDKFCGLRLSGERQLHAPHCRGDACVHFAPAQQIALRWLPGADAVAPPIEVPATPSPASLPRVSCIMPTRNRLKWVLQSIAYFQRQDYPERELVIIDDGATDLTPELPCEPRLRYVHVRTRLSIGSKRNQACALATGQIVVQWDDDDWYAPGRISAQVAPILAGTADITALGGTCFFDLERWKFWRCTPALHQRLFVLDVHGGTLAFRRGIHERMARYPDASLAEDAAFLKAAVGRGARLQSIDIADLFLYLRHGGNAWAFQAGKHVDPAGWLPCDEPGSLAPDRDFYAGMSPAAAPAPAPGLPASPAAPARPEGLPSIDAPLVSCIMPTCDRRGFVRQAIAYFLRQDYARRELVIVDDGQDRIADLVPDHPAIRYVGLQERMRLGSKRNVAIEASAGEIIMHWDDDDWMDGRRISVQVDALLRANADITGTSAVRFYDVASDRFSMYRYPSSRRRWLYGATLCYRKALWQRKRFGAIDLGEDTAFVWAPPQGNVLDMKELSVFTAIVHGSNTSRPQPLSGPYWSAWNEAAAAAVLGGDWDFYRALREHARR